MSCKTVLTLLIVAALYVWLVVEVMKMLSEEDIGNDPE